MNLPPFDDACRLVPVADGASGGRGEIAREMTAREQAVAGRCRRVRGRWAVHRAGLWLAVLATTCVGTGCQTRPALRTLAGYNAQNAQALNANARVVGALYQSSVETVVELTLRAHLQLVADDLMATLGPPGAPPDAAATWSRLMTEAGGAVAGRWGVLQAELALGPNGDERETLSRRFGWLFTAADDSTFTPARAHAELVVRLDGYRSGNDAPGALGRAIELLAAYDRQTAEIKLASSDALLVARRLSDALTTQAGQGETYATKLAVYADAETSLQALGAGLLATDEAQLLFTRTLETALPDERRRTAVLQLFADLFAKKP